MANSTVKANFCMLQYHSSSGAKQFEKQSSNIKSQTQTHIYDFQITGREIIAIYFEVSE